MDPSRWRLPRDVAKIESEQNEAGLTRLDPGLAFVRQARIAGLQSMRRLEGIEARRRNVPPIVGHAGRRHARALDCVS